MPIQDVVLKTSWERWTIETGCEGGSGISVGWLVVWVLWHNHLCRLFNTKYIFMQIVLFQTIQFSVSTVCQKYSYFNLLSTQFDCQNHGLFLFNPSIEPLSGVASPGQSETGSNGNEEVLRIPQPGTSASDCLVSYPGDLLWGGVYTSEEVQSVYSIAPAD